METQNSSKSNSQLIFEAVSDTETKAIVTREGETFEFRVLHASPSDIEEFKLLKENLFKNGEEKKVVV